MTVVTEHHCEQEWESNHCEDGWVSFLIERHAIGVSDFLVDERYLAHLEVSRWLDDVGVSVTTLDLFEFSAAEVRDSFLDDVLLFDGRPEEADVSGAAALHHIQGIVDGLLLGDEPGENLESAGAFIALLVTVVVYVIQILLQLVD